MNYDEEEQIEEKSFKINDTEEEIFDDAFDDTLDPIDEEMGFKFDDEEEPEEF